MGKKATKVKEPKQKKPRGKKDNASKVKRPLSAYFYFLKDKRETYKQEHPEWSNKDFIVQMGGEWKTLSAEAKLPYEKLAVEDKKRFDKEKKGDQKGDSKPNHTSEKEEKENGLNQENGSAEEEDEVEEDAEEN